MATGIIQGATGAPGAQAYGQQATNAALFNELNIIIPDWIPDLFDRYGTERYALIMEVLNKTTLEEFQTTTRTYSHFEKGRAFGAVFANATVGGITPGADVTVPLGPGSYNNPAGTATPARIGEYVRIRSNGKKGRIIDIPVTTPNAFQIVVRPALLAETFASGDGQAATLIAGEALEMIGNIAAGEGSGRMSTQAANIFRIDNTITEVRDDATITDVARQNKTQVNFGNGDQYYYKFLQQELNKRFLYYIENTCLEGISVDNITGTVGTAGVIPQVEARGSSVNYLIGNAGIADLQNLTRVMDFNGGPSEYHVLQEIKQRQDVNNTLFGKYNNGGIRYATVGGREEAAISYGFQSFHIDTYSMHFFRYKPFSGESIFGYTPNPALGSFRDYFGLLVPQGVVPDAQSGTLRPNMQWVYQKQPDAPGVKIYTWETGPWSPNGKTDTAEHSIHQLCYVGARVISPEQFIIFRGVNS